MILIPELTSILLGLGNSHPKGFSKSTSEETLVEARSDSDVKIDRQT